MIWTNVRFQNLCHNFKRSQQRQKKKKFIHVCVCMYVCMYVSIYWYEIFKWFYKNK